MVKRIGHRLGAACSGFLRLGLFKCLLMVCLLSSCASPKTYIEGLKRWRPNDESFQRMETPDLKVLAEEGSNEAKFSLAVRLMNGDRVGRDEERAVETIEDIAKAGDARAQYLLGSAYISGSGVPKDEAEGVKWLERSAKQGYPNGEYWYGYMLSRGRGTSSNKQNWHEGLKWIRRAAMNGHDDAQFTLGEAYESCRGGLPQDFEEAARWYRLADKSNNGHMLARFNLRRLIDLGLVGWQEGDTGAPPLTFVDMAQATFEDCEGGRAMENIQ